MSKSVSSPTARLLQSSRLFSLPRPLPAPVNDTHGLFRASDTATLPYPTHQAITSPASSLHKGDFGLKRSLPAKSTRHTTTPVVRVSAQDTYEHITDFASAADHVLNERKWAEMGVPFVKKGSKEEAKTGGPVQSVFENWLDNTDPHARATEEMRAGKSATGEVRGARAPRVMQRWKYAGPWIPGMQEGEFRRWLERSIDGRKGEWREFVRRKEVDAQVAMAQRQAREQGEPLSAADLARLRVEMRPTDEQLVEVEKDLRDTHASDRLSSNLTAMIAEFLDLPNIYFPGGANTIEPMKTAGMQQWRDNFAASEDHGPPTTHPSAGLSFLRSNAVMENHPLYGPQASPTPIQARVLRARLSSLGSDHRAKLGVAGFVTEDPQTGTNAGTTKNRRRRDEPLDPAEQMDEDVVGGGRVWVQPGTAHVDERGRVRLGVERADLEALAVKKGGEELERVLEAKRASRVVGMGQGGVRMGPTSSRAFGL